MLRLIVGSKLPAAERFNRWVFEKVLPASIERGATRCRCPDLGAAVRLPQHADCIAAASRGLSLSGPSPCQTSRSLPVRSSQERLLPVTIRCQ